MISFVIEDGVYVMRLQLDHETVARLMHVADLSHAEPATVAASILHDVLKDDEDAHLMEPPESNVVPLAN